MKKISHLLATSLLFAIPFASITSCDFNTNRYTINNNIATIKYSDDKSYTVGGGEISANTIISEIEIDWLSGAVNIIPSTDNVIKFSEKADKEITEDLKLRYKVDTKGKLSIQFAKNGTYNIEDLNKSLNLYIPSSYTKITDFECDNIDGNISLASDKFNNISLESVSGEIIIYNLSADYNEVDVDSVSGSVSLACNFINNLNVEAVSSRINVSCTKINFCDLETISGDIVLQTKEANSIEIDSTAANATLILTGITGFRTNFESENGSFSSSYESNKSGNIYTYGDGSTYIEFDSLTGDLQIKKSLLS